jgi:hypothetical protein
VRDLRAFGMVMRIQRTCGTEMKRMSMLAFLMGMVLLTSQGQGQVVILQTKLAVFLITLSGLILEVGLTRIYSASIWYQ